MTKKFLKVISVLYVIGTICLVVLGILCFTPIGNDLIKNIPYDFSSQNPSNLPKTTLFAVGFFIMAVFSLIYFILVRRAIKDGTKTTLLLGLSVLHVIGGVVSIFKILSNGFNPEFVTTVINIVLDVCVLIALFKIRIEADEINK